MTPRTLNRLRTLLLPLVLALLVASASLVASALQAASALPADTTLTFQNGANGYTGAQDYSINTQYLQFNGGNGTQTTGAPQQSCYVTTGTDVYEMRYLLKFGGLDIPAGSTVVSASLTISPEWWSSGTTNITGYYLQNSWDGASSRLGWLHRDGTNDWATGGASLAGVDTVAGKSFQLPALRPVGTEAVTIPLDVAQVQSWIDAPATNQGVMLVNNNPGDIVRITSTVGTRPIGRSFPS